LKSRFPAQNRDNVQRVVDECAEISFAADQLRFRMLPPGTLLRLAERACLLLDLGVPALFVVAALDARNVC
jgi:hypothetical protein